MYIQFCYLWHCSYIAYPLSLRCKDICWSPLLSILVCFHFFFFFSFGFYVSEQDHCNLVQPCTWDLASLVLKLSADILQILFSLFWVFLENHWSSRGIESSPVHVMYTVDKSWQIDLCGCACSGPGVESISHLHWGTVSLTLCKHGQRY